MEDNKWFLTSENSDQFMSRLNRAEANDEVVYFFQYDSFKEKFLVKHVMKNTEYRWSKHFIINRSIQIEFDNKNKYLAFGKDGVKQKKVSDLMDIDKKIERAKSTLKDLQDDREVLENGN